MTPDEIARHISESSGAHITGRTVWDKAKRLGLSKKIGRLMLISIDDIPKLLVQEDTKEQRRLKAASAKTEQLLKRMTRTNAKLRLAGKE
jgi:hypothetical protein